MITRRTFLAQAALAAIPLRAAEPTRIVDTHTHFYDPTRPEGVPWPDPNDALLYRKVMPAEYRKLAEPHGVRGTVVVEASPWVEDNQWLLDLAAREPFILGIVGNLDPLAADFATNLARFAKTQSFAASESAANSSPNAAPRSPTATPSAASPPPTSRSTSMARTTISHKSPRSAAPSQNFASSSTTSAVPVPPQSSHSNGATASVLPEKADASFAKSAPSPSNPASPPAKRPQIPRATAPSSTPCGKHLATSK